MSHQARRAQRNRNVGTAVHGAHNISTLSGRREEVGEEDVGEEEVGEGGRDGLRGIGSGSGSGSRGERRYRYRYRGFLGERRNGGCRREDGGMQG